MNTRTRRRPHRDDGVAALELVLVLPFLMALLFGIVNFGLYWKQSVDTTSVARDAARSAALGLAPSYPTGMREASRTGTCTAGNVSNTVTVVVRSDFTFSIPFIPLGTRTIEARGTMRCGG